MYAAKWLQLQSFGPNHDSSIGRRMILGGNNNIELKINQTDPHQMFSIVFLVKNILQQNIMIRKRRFCIFWPASFQRTFQQPYILFSSSPQGQLQQRMMQFNMRREENQYSINIKSLKESHGLVSKMTRPSYALKTPSGQQRTFSIRVKINNFPPPRHSAFLPAQSASPEDQKSSHLNRIAESVEGLKKGLILYRHLEQDEEKCRQTVLSWFRKTEAAFLHCLKGSGYLGLEKTAQEEEKKGGRNFPILTQENVHTESSEHSKSINEALTRQIEQLRDELEAYRRDCNQALQHLQSITKIAAELRSRLETQQKQIQMERHKRESLITFLSDYVEKAESIIQKISGKQESEGRVTALEQEIRRGLIIIIFNAYVAQAI